MTIGRIGLVDTANAAMEGLEARTVENIATVITRAHGPRQSLSSLGWQPR